MRAQRLVRRVPVPRLDRGNDGFMLGQRTDPVILRQLSSQAKEIIAKDDGAFNIRDDCIDQELFNREKNIPVLTSTGKALLPVAKSILDQQKYFDQKVESLTQEDEHMLAVLGGYQ